MPSGCAAQIDAWLGPRLMMRRAWRETWATRPSSPSARSSARARSGSRARPTSTQIVAFWTAAFPAVKADGSYDRIIARYVRLEPAPVSIGRPRSHGDPRLSRCTGAGRRAPIIRRPKMKKPRGRAAWHPALGTLRPALAAPKVAAAPASARIAPVGQLPPTARSCASRCASPPGPSAGFPMPSSSWRSRWSSWPPAALANGARRGGGHQGVRRRLLEPDPFTMQMAFVTIGGYVVATSPPAQRLIDRLALAARRPAAVPSASSPPSACSPRCSAGGSA